VLDKPTVELPRTWRALAEDVTVVDDLLPPNTQALVRDFLQRPGWQFGWKSARKTDVYSFWHKHFAGHRNSKNEPKYECSEELSKSAPLAHWFWVNLNKVVFRNTHALYRCYANAQTYGSDGTVHTDSKSDRSYTCVYYANADWQPNWAGETVIFTPDKSDIITSIYPRPNRLAIFRGNMPHVARGVSRTCPVLRVVLAFKSELPDDPGPAPTLPDDPGERQQDPP